jgi:hypothetical protein
LGCDDDPDGVSKHGFVDLGRSFLDVVAKFLAQLCRLIDRIDTFRINVVKSPRLGGEGDSEPLRVGTDFRLI